MIGILKETDRLIVCVKPVGAVSQGERPKAMPQLLAAQLGCTGYPVHRLDQAVGGVIVYAKTAQEAARLTQQMGQGGMQKTYLAVLTHCPPEHAGVLEDLLYHDRMKNKTYVVKRSRGGVKQARLRYEIVSGQLETGRTHQIRVQFASRGCPLLGDGKYGGSDNRCTCALWSYRLTLCLPGGKFETFTANPPERFPWTEFVLSE